MSTVILHGIAHRGLDSNLRSTLFEGSYGRMFRTLPAAKFTEKGLKNLAKAMIAKIAPIPNALPAHDPEENPGIDAGYTYLGQFIDHDLTFDPASSLQKQNDPDGLVDYRTPRFDLDSLYGRGPADQPYLYASDGKRMLLGRVLTGVDNVIIRDLPRIVPESTQDASLSARALIGDPRNDENVIIAQLHATFIRFHNRMCELMPDATFAQVQQQVRWHYQWLVLHDFLPKIVGQDSIHQVLPHLKTNESMRQNKPVLNYFFWRNDPFIPVEFSAAAYRFGHSMVRPFYKLNKNLPFLFPIFNVAKTAQEEDLIGFRAFPDNWAIDWDLFFGPAELIGENRVQKSFRIDTSLADPMGNLPLQVAQQIPSLAERNLLRGLRMGLPNGQDVARFMGIKPLEDKDLRIGRAVATEPKISIDNIDPEFQGNTPLWAYILAEAQYMTLKNGQPHLGPVGSSIIAEVFIGLLLGDSHSFLHLNPDWKPQEHLMSNGQFTMRDFIQFALAR
jgi:hypothetical protein